MHVYPIPSTDVLKIAIAFPPQLEEDIEKLSMLDGMRNKNHVLELCRLMVRAEKVQHRIAILKIMQVRINYWSN